MSADSSIPENSEKAFLDEAKKRFQIAEQAEAQTRREEVDDQKFMAGEQWPLDIKHQRELDNRPCLVINRLPQFVRQITNEQRQNRPAIKVDPVDDAADIDTAKVFQGIVRHVEYNSKADIAYDTAFEKAVESGIGYFRITTEFRDPVSFQQELKIKAIKDRFSVYLDPFFEEPDGSDAEWGFIFDEIPKDEFKQQFPDAELSSMQDWRALGDMHEGWVQENAVRVAEYYYKIYEPVDLVLLSDKTVLPKDQLPKRLPKGIKIVSERRTLIPKVKWAKINGVEILEQTDCAGRWIPIVPVIGEQSRLDGQRVYSGIIRHAKDPQRQYNYWISAMTETIALAPRAPWIGYEGQFEGYEDQWATANVKNHAFLQVKAKSLGGQPLPLPQRNVFEPPIQAMSAVLASSADDMKATTGIYDSAVGNMSNEVSGIAIQRRSVQSQTSNFHFMDNLSRSLRHAGRILINWIPTVYDTPQALRVIGDDGSVDIVKVNQIFNEAGEEKAHFLDLGTYDVTVDAGPSYQTKRQEAVSSILDMIKVAPQLMPIAGDLLIGNMDWNGAQEIAERLKATLPPQFQNDKDQKPLPSAVTQQMTQMSNMIKALSAELEKTSEIIKSKRMDVESKERIALLNAETALRLAVLKSGTENAQLVYQTEVDQLNQRLNLLGENQTIPQSLGIGGPQTAASQPSQPQQSAPTGGPQTPGQPMGV